MAAKSLLNPLRALAVSTHPSAILLRASGRTSSTYPITARGAAATTQHHRIEPRHFHSIPSRSAATAQSTGTTPTGTTPSPVVPDDPHEATRHAAFLGEADSNDAFEAAREVNPPVHEPLDATHAAFLGEADSDDGFVAENEVRPRPVPPVDASQSAFLGEADSDDGFEAMKVERGESDHGIVDGSVSAFHGESGEQDSHDH